MTENFPGPYELRLFYTVDVSPGGPLTHEARNSLNLETDPDVGDAFADINCVLRGGGTEDLETMLDRWVNVFEDFYDSGDTTIDYCELWKYTPGTYQAQWISTEALNQAGTATTGNRAAAESIITFRTTNGGIFKIAWQDSIAGPSPPVVYADTNQVTKDVIDFYTHPTTAPFIARDNGWPAVSLKIFSGQNEHIFKIRYGRT